MNITYVLLSPTFGMHQYTADLANRAVATGSWGLQTSSPSLQPATCNPQPPTTSVITTATLPRDRYSPAVQIDAPVTTHGTGFSREGLDIAAYRRALDTIVAHCAPRTAPLTSHITASRVHFTAVHAWNIPLVRALRRRQVPVVHTLHDLDPHTGVRFPALIRLWNRLIIGAGCHLLVHGRRYRDQLLAQGVSRDRITCAPLLHGFLAADRPWPPVEDWEPESKRSERDCNAACKMNVLFFGRVEAYKGVDTLLAAWSSMLQVASEHNSSDSCDLQPKHRLTIAGPVSPGVTLPPLPLGAELRDRRINDKEGDALFRSADLLVLPYRDASQSALVAAAYAYSVPVIVTQTGALPEYVVEGETGWIVPPDDPAALAAALHQALANPARLAGMGAAGRAWFTARRREEEITLASLYRQLL